MTTEGKPSANNIVALKPIQFALCLDPSTAVISLFVQHFSLTPSGFYIIIFKLVRKLVNLPYVS